jgi:ADP-dependent NAD(P)H-hydrate dehydratase / NAD(P)H-hydrate epimerase
MTCFLTSAQMRAIEGAAIGSGEVTGRALMEVAGAAVVAAIRAVWPGDRGPAVVFCGPGNNGGDGYVIARLLAAEGRAVRVFALGESGSADAQAARADWTGGVLPLAALDWPDLAQRPLVVDALFGTGLLRAVAPGVWGALAMAQDSGCRTVAVDVVSGLCADSGRLRSEGGCLDRAVDLTVTFDSPRLGHMLADGAWISGRLVVADIGLGRWREEWLRAQGAAVVLAAEPGRPLDKAGAHKYAHGHLAVLSGGVGHGGAARLAARGALRVGAGLVTLLCPPAALQENACRLDAVMLRSVRDGAALAQVLADRRINGLCLGPGLGLGAREVGLVAGVLAAGRATVLDADALTLVAGDDGLRGALHGGCVVTPHGGEFARLFPAIAARLEAEPEAGVPAYSRVDAARGAAAEAGCVVLLKGADTVIAAPDGRCAVHAAVRERAVPWLATAGSGDVLAGIIAGLMARGFGPFQAAETGAWLHAEAARAFGPGLIAEDLPDALPAGVAKLADAPDLGSGAARRGGSSPSTRTKGACRPRRNFPLASLRKLC